MVFVNAFFHHVFQRLHPADGRAGAFDVEAAGVEDVLHVHLAVIGLDDIGGGVQAADDGADKAELFGFKAVHLVQDDRGAEFDLLDDEVGDILVLKVFVHQLLAAHELVHKAQGVHHRDHAVEAAYLGQGFVAKADGLRDGQGLADAGSLDKDVVEAVRLDKVEYLLQKVGLQGTADAAVFQRHEAVVFKFNGAALGNERGVDIYLADIIHDNGNLVAFLIGKHMIEQGGLARAEIAGQNRDGNYFSSHYADLLLKDVCDPAKIGAFSAASTFGAQAAAATLPSRAAWLILQRYDNLPPQWRFPMQHVFNPERVCAKVFMIDIDEQTRTIRNFEFKGGCPGNLNGISRLIRGMHIDEVIERFADMPICPASKVTSCPEQLRKGLIELRDKLNAGEAPSRPSFVLDSFSFGKM